MGIKQFGGKESKDWSIKEIFQGGIFTLWYFMPLQRKIQKDSSKCKGGKEVHEVLEEYDLVSMYEIVYISSKESSQSNS